MEGEKEGDGGERKNGEEERKGGKTEEEGKKRDKETGTKGGVNGEAADNEKRKETWKYGKR
jgi:hypothetical protein